MVHSGPRAILKGTNMKTLLATAFAALFAVSAMAATLPDTAGGNPFSNDGGDAGDNGGGRSGNDK